MTQPAVLTVKEVAALLNVHPSTVRGYLHRGELPYIRLGGKLMILRGHVERMLEPARP